MLLLALPLAACRCWRLLFLLSGILWMQGNLHYRLAWLDQLGKKTSHIITAQVQSAEPSGDKDRDHFTRLLLRVETLDALPLTPAPLVRVNAYQALPPLPAGSRVTLVTSLKPAHGLANEAGMDGRRLLLGKGITATGNLRRIIEVTAAPPGWRERWLTAADTAWQGLVQAPLLAALTFGEQGGITDAQWDLFRGSGLTHIIAISGQHIALVAVLGWWLGRLFGLRGAILVSLLFAATYSWLAGFAVATERALIMVLVWSLLRWLKRDWPSHRIWLWAFVVIALWDPFAFYSAGFWLSFLAVALLLLASLLHERPGLVRLQLLLLLGLLPLQLLLFEGMAPLALLLNLLALPLFCLGIIPLALIGVLLAPLSTSLAHGLLWLSDLGLEWVLWGLARLASQVRLWWPVPGWLMPASTLLILLWAGRQLPGAGAGRGAGALGARHPGRARHPLRYRGSLPRWLQHGGRGHPARAEPARSEGDRYPRHQPQGPGSRRQPAGGAAGDSRAPRALLLPVRAEYPGLSPWPGVALAGARPARALARATGGGAQQRQLRRADQRRTASPPAQR